MATFEEIIKEIKSKVSITDVVEKYVDLKGNKASCPFPFHQDDTPSFFIYPETDTWRCYGCSISFVYCRRLLCVKLNCFVGGK